VSPFHRAARFEDEDLALLAYSAVAEIVILLGEGEIAAYRLTLGGAWHVVVVAGREPSAGVLLVVEHVMAEGERVDLSADTVEKLLDRHHEGSRKVGGDWVEHHRPGLQL